MDDTLRDRIAAHVPTGYGDPLDDLMSRMLIEGWRYEDDWYSPQRLREMLDAAGLTVSTATAPSAEPTVERHCEACASCDDSCPGIRTHAIAPSAGLREALGRHIPWARAEFAANRIWLACCCGFNLYGNDYSVWIDHAAPSADPALSAGLHDECRAEIDRLWDQIANTSADMTLAAAFASTMPAPAIDAERPCGHPCVCTDEGRWRMERALAKQYKRAMGDWGMPCSDADFRDDAINIAAAYAAESGKENA